MTQQEWLEAARLPVLRELIANWHPSARQPRAIQQESVLLANGEAVAVPVPEANMTITAPNAEAACQQIRQEIRRQEPTDPVARWDAALAAGNIGELSCLLDGAWFGVPESTQCWQIPGFSEAVALLDDPPEEEDSEPPHQTGCICADCSGAELTADND